MSLYNDISLYYNAAAGKKVGSLMNMKAPFAPEKDLSVVRAGTTAYTQNPDGTWRPAAANEPRYTYENGVPAILVEPAATRLNTYPFSFANAVWTKSGAVIEGDSATADINPELFSNYSFEENVNGLTPTRCTIVWNALKYATCTQNSGSLNTFNITPSVFVVNKLFRIKFIAKSNTTTEKPTILSYHFDSIVLKIQPSLSTEWQEYEFYGVPKYAYSYIYLVTNPVIDGISVDIDNLSIKEVTGFSGVFTDANGVNLKNAYKLVEDNSNNFHFLRSPLITVTPGNRYVNTVYVKKDTLNYLCINLVTSATANLVYINLNNSTIVSKDVDLECEIEQAALGYKKITTSIIAGNSDFQFGYFLSKDGVNISYQGDGSSGIYICGAQLEAGTTATSPIGGAEGSQQTRNADVITLTYALPTSGTIRFRGYFPASYPLQINACVAEVTGWKDIRYVYSDTNQKLYVDEVLIDEVNIVADFTEMTGLTFQAENGNEFPFTNFSIQ